MKLTAVLLDDERNGREVLKRLLESNCSEVEVVDMASNITEAIALANDHKPDILFLDIRLGNDLGLDIIPFLAEPLPHIIVTTSYQEFAIKAIKARAIDYLLKPIVRDELKSAIKKVMDLHAANGNEITDKTEFSTNGFHSSKRIAVPVSDGLTFVDMENIIRCEASGSYTQIFLKAGTTMLLSLALGEVEKMLTEHNGFFRIHHSSIINTGAVVRYIRSDGGYVLLCDLSRVPVSQRKRKKFLQFIGVTD